MKCAVTNCEEEGIEQHHVTYNDPVIRVLCSKHHIQITAINSHQARKQHHALSDKQRWFLWFRFIDEKIKTRVTYLDREWRNQNNIPLSTPNQKITSTPPDSNYKIE